jgi:hypothetical protein
LSFPCLSFPRLSFPCARRGDAAGQFCGAERCCLLANDDRRTHLVEPTGSAFRVKPGGPNLGAQTWGQELAASIVCIAECPVFGLITWLRQSVLGCGSGRLNDCPVFSVGAVVFVLLKCESGSGASLGACDGNLSFGAGGHPVVQPTCLTGSVVRENSAPTVGWRGFRGAMNDLTRWILWRSRKRAVRWPTGERSCVRGKHIYFQGSSLYPEDGFCAW